LPPFFTSLCGVRVLHDVKLHDFAFSVPCCDVRYDFHVKRCSIRLDSHMCFVGGSCFIYVIFIYLRILVSNTISILDYVRVVPEHMIFGFLSEVLWVVVCPFVLFLLVIVLSVLWFAASYFS